MQRESCCNAEIAVMVNQHCIPVKVDREPEVAADADMIAYAQSSLGSEGYPLCAVRNEKPGRLKKIKPSAMLAEKCRRQLVQETLEQAEIWRMDTVAEFDLGYLPINRTEICQGTKSA